MLLCTFSLQVQPVCSPSWLALMLLSTSACSCKRLAPLGLVFMLLCTSLVALNLAAVHQVHAGLAAKSTQCGPTSLTTTSSFMSQSHHSKLHGKQHQVVSCPCYANSTSLDKHWHNACHH